MKHNVLAGIKNYILHKPFDPFLVLLTFPSTVEESCSTLIALLKFSSRNSP